MSNSELEKIHANDQEKKDDFPLTVFTIEENQFDTKSKVCFLFFNWVL